MTIYRGSIRVDGNLDNAVLSFSPPVGTKWRIDHMAITGDQSRGGIVYCNVFIDGTFWCGSSTGLGDSADGTPLLAMPSQLLEFRWIPDKTFIPIFPTTPVTLSANILVTEANV